MANLQLVTDMSVYADFYATIQFMEAARNRVINACKSVSRTRIVPEQEAEIVTLVCRIYNHMFAKGKAAIQQLENHLQAARQAALAKDVDTQKKETNAAIEWCRAAATINRATMKVVVQFCDFVTQHTPNNDDNLTPSVDPNQKIDMSTYVAKLRKLWSIVS